MALVAWHQSCQTWWRHCQTWLLGAVKLRCGDSRRRSVQALQSRDKQAYYFFSDNASLRRILTFSEETRLPRCPAEAGVRTQEMVQNALSATR